MSIYNIYKSEIDMDLRERLYNALLKEPLSFRALGKEIGVNEQVLARFVEKHKVIRFNTRLKIESWLNKKEKELNP